MILILSSDHDQTTSDVIEWLLFLQKPFIRLNEYDLIKNIEVTNNEILISTEKTQFKFSQITSYWYRRKNFSLGYTEWFDFKDEDFKQIVNAHLRTEIITLIQYLHLKLQEKKHLSSALSYEVNKLFIANLADEAGLKTPKSLITKSAKNAVSFINKQTTGAITKPLNHGISGGVNGKTISAYTESITPEHINENESDFFPSLLQENIHKKYELRVFHIDGENYAMAIFSQGDEQTKVDFRKYNLTKPNRNVPFKLPADIEQKFNSLMKRIGLNTGSADFIVTPKGEFVFLEVNAVGQFGMTSIPCNYKLEKRIAKYLN